MQPRSRVLNVSALLAWAAVSAIAQQPNPNRANPGASPPTASSSAPIQAFHIGNGVTPPKATYNPEPEYSEEARRNKASGKVELDLIVDAGGHPENIHVTRAAGMGLDEKAIDAVKQWKFEPGTKDGKPVAVFATIEITFQLDGSALLEPSPEDPFEAAHIAGKAGQQSVVGLGRPTEWGVPKYPPDALTRNVQGRVILLLTVGKNGHVKKASAISGDPLLTQAASDAVRKWWKFAPPTRDGKRVEAQTSATIEFKLVGRTPEISGTYFAAPVPTPQASQR